MKENNFPGSEKTARKLLLFLPNSDLSANDDTPFTEKTINVYAVMGRTRRSRISLQVLSRTALGVSLEVASPRRLIIRRVCQVQKNERRVESLISKVCV